MRELFTRAVSNLAFAALGLGLLYWAICRDLIELNLGNMLTRLDVRLAEMLDAGHTCQAAALQFQLPLIQELCVSVAIDALLVVLSVWLLMQCHRRWAKLMMIALAALFFVDGPGRLYDATFPAPVIVGSDPSFAMIDEELTV